MTQTPSLRDYQREDVEFLKERPHAGCFNQQRTGKTPTSLTVFKELNLKKFLIICPNSAMYAWAEEVARWHGAKAVLGAGTRKAREKVYANWTEGALIVNYEVLRGNRTATWDLDQILKHKDLQGLIVDEAHRIRNQKSRQAQALKKFKWVPRILLLTGTPAPNKVSEIFMLLHMIDPHRFNSYWKFADEYFEVLQVPVYVKGGPRMVREVGALKKNKKQELLRFLQEHCTLRKRAQVMDWLPAKDYQQIKLPLTREQIKYIKELHTYFETETVITAGVLDQLLRIRQVCQAPELLGLKGRSPKIDWLKDYLNDYPERPVLIFSKFTSLLNLISKELEIPHLITGPVSRADRARRVNDFQSGKIQVLLLNIDAAKEALTLDRAEAAIFMDTYPPAGDIEQAEDRFVATTQQYKDKPHTIIQLMMKDSYDEILFQLVRQRATETEVINNYKKYISQKEVNAQ